MDQNLTPLHQASPVAHLDPVDPTPLAQIPPQALPQTLPQVPIDVRNLSLIVLCVLALIAMLRWASALFIPLMLGLMFCYALSPVVDALARVRVPRALGAGVLILAILGVVGGAAWSMAPDANELIDSLPEVALKVRDSMHKRSSAQATPLEIVQKAAAELERAAEGGNTPLAGNRGVQRVVVEKARFNIRDYLVSGTLGIFTVVGQLTLVTFLTYFLLLSGDTFRRKLVKITGPTLSNKKLTVQALDEINAQMQRYLLVQVLVSVGVGLAIGIAFALLGLKHAAVWGVAAGVLNLVPYVGAIAVTAGAALVAFVQFGEVDAALAVGGVALVINMVKGYLIVPWLTSKTSSLNPVSVFVGVLAWGWLWGVWGLLLGIPIMMVIKAVCDRVDHLKPVGELLGT